MYFYTSFYAHWMVSKFIFAKTCDVSLFFHFPKLSKHYFDIYILQDGNRPLHIAVMYEQADVIRVLVELGADINAAGKVRFSIWTIFGCKGTGYANINNKKNPERLICLIFFLKKKTVMHFTGKTKEKQYGEMHRKETILTLFLIEIFNSTVPNNSHRLRTFLFLHRSMRKMIRWTLCLYCWNTCTVKTIKTSNLNNHTTREKG